MAKNREFWKFVLSYWDVEDKSVTTIEINIEPDGTSIIKTHENASGCALLYLSYSGTDFHKYCIREADLSDRSLKCGKKLNIKSLTN